MLKIEVSSLKIVIFHVLKRWLAPYLEKSSSLYRMLDHVDATPLGYYLYANMNSTIVTSVKGEYCKIMPSDYQKLKLCLEQDLVLTIFLNPIPHPSSSPYSLFFHYSHQSRNATIRFSMPAANVTLHPFHLSAVIEGFRLFGVIMLL